MKGAPLSTSLVISDAEGRGFLELESGKADQFWVTVERDGKSVREQTYACRCCDGFVEFFEDLAAKARGWKGVRTWTPPVGGLALRAALEGADQVALALEVTPYGKPDDVPYMTTLRVAREDLKRIAREVRRLFPSKLESKR